MATDNSKRKIGTMPCEGQRCKSHDRGTQAVIFENKHGTLSYSCDWCGRAPYAKKGTEQHADWMEDIALFDAPPAEPETIAAPEVAPAPPPAPAKKGAMSWLPS